MKNDISINEYNKQINSTISNNNINTQKIDSTLESYNNPNVTNKEYKNVVSNQKDVTIDLSIFLDYQQGKFFNNSDNKWKV